MDRDTPTKVMNDMSLLASMMGEKTLHLLAMRSREMSNRLGMRRAKRKCAPLPLHTKAPHNSTYFGAGGGSTLHRACIVLRQRWRENQREMHANIAPFWWR